MADSAGPEPHPPCQISPRSTRRVADGVGAGPRRINAQKAIGFNLGWRVQSRHVVKIVSRASMGNHMTESGVN